MEYHTNTRLDQTSRDAISTRVSRVLTFRRATLPFPLDREQVEDLATHVFGRDARMLMMQLADMCPDAVNWEAGIIVVVKDATLSIPHYTHESRGTPAPARGYGRRHKPSEELLPGMPYYQELVDWINDARRIDWETWNIQSVVSAVLSQLGTYGQVSRLWPNVCQWLPNRDKLRTSAQQTRRSSLPTEFRVGWRDSPNMASVTRTLKLWEMKDKLIDVDTKLAMALMTKAAMGKTGDDDVYPAPVWL